MQDLTDFKVRRGGIFVPYDVLRVLQGRDLRLRASEAAIVELDSDIHDVIERDIRAWISQERIAGKDRRRPDYFIVDNRAMRQAEILMQLKLDDKWEAEPAPHAPSLRTDADAVVDDREARLEKAMEAAVEHPESAAIVQIRADLAAYRNYIANQNKHLEASDRKRNELERRVVKLENGSAAGNLVRRVTLLEETVNKLREAIGALRGMAL